MLQQARTPLTRTARLLLTAAVCTVALGTGALAVAFGGTPAFAAELHAAGDKPQQVPSGVMAGQVLTRVMPKYPEDAKKAKIQGVILLAAVIGKDGTIQNLNVVSGPEELRASALKAVRQWTYKPYLLNGDPTDVETTITVNYSLAP